MVDKIFNFGTNPTDIIGEFRYTNGEYIQYSTANYPPVTVTVHNWQDISIVNKALIISALTSKGYVEA